MVDLIVYIMSFLLMIIGFCFLIHLMIRSNPLFKIRCKDCKHKDRDWKIVPIGHDDFAWQHNCKENKK